MAAGATRVGGPGPGHLDALQRRGSQLVQGAPNVGAEATDPSTYPWWCSALMSAIASPPSASTATSTGFLPRSCTGRKERHAVAFDSSLVNPLRSASNLTAMLPAWATTPVPSADTDNPDDHVVSFTCEVPLSLGHLNSRQVQVSLTRQALSRDQARCQFTTRERSGLAQENVRRLAYIGSARKPGTAISPRPQLSPRARPASGVVAEGFGSGWLPPCLSHHKAFARLTGVRMRCQIEMHLASRR